MEYNVNALFDMVNDWINAENYLQWSIIEWKKEDKYNRIPNDKVRYYNQYDAESRTYYYALANACKMVNANIKTVIAVVKSMNRYERHNNWEKCAHIALWQEDKLRKLFSLD